MQACAQEATLQQAASCSALCTTSPTCRFHGFQHCGKGESYPGLWQVPREWTHGFSLCQPSTPVVAALQPSECLWLRIQ